MCVSVMCVSDMCVSVMCVSVMCVSVMCVSDMCQMCVLTPQVRLPTAPGKGEWVWQTACEESNNFTLEAMKVVW